MKHHPLDYAILVLSLICLLLVVPLAVKMVSAAESSGRAEIVQEDAARVRAEYAYLIEVEP